MDMMDLLNGRVTTIQEGKWSEGDVHVEFNNNFTPLLFRSDEIRAAAISRFLTRKESNPRLFDGDARHLSLANSSFQDNKVTLAIGPLTYAVYDVCRQEFMKEFGWRLEDLPIGIGMSAVIVTADSRIVLHERSQTVDFPGITALPGGILDGNSPFEHVRKELREELGIESRAIEELLLLGISHRLEQRINNELNFFVKLSLSSFEVSIRERRAAEKEGLVHFVDCAPNTVREFIISRHEKMLPGQVFCLIQAGRHLWGREWSKIGAE